MRSEYSLMRLSYDKFLQIFPRASSRTARYGMAVVSSGFMLFVLLILGRILAAELPLTMLVIPVAVSALFGGVGPGLLATLLCGVASEYFLTEPHFSLKAMDTADWERLGLFLATSVLLTWMIEMAHVARQEVEDRAQEAEQRQIELEAQIIERERARAERERLIAELETERARLRVSVEEEKRAREAFRINKEWLNIAQKANRIGTFEWNIQAKTVVYSEEGEVLLGLAPGSFGGRYEDWTRCVYSEDLQLTEQELGHALIDGEGTSEYRVIWPNGETHWLQWRGKVYFDEAGRPMRMMGINIDVTERKKLDEALRRQAEALREADRRKDDFLATLAHELRNPLAPLRNAVQILTLRGSDPALVAQTCEVMGRQVQQIVRLVDDLLEVSRIGQGKISLQKAPVDMADVVATAVETSRPLIDAHRHKLTVSLPGSPTRVEADATRLAQVLSNLLNNAAKYTEDGGQIDLIIERAGKDAVARVRDNGIGIAPEEMPHLFDMFRQIESSANRSQGGLGIGLTLVRRLVEMHGGRIEARSAGLGKGSEFTVRLPAIAEPALAAVGPEPARKPTEESSAPAPVGARRVLIVDDNADSAESMAVLLRLRGHEVRLAYDGQSALEKAQTFRPDVMFLDLSLPKMDGYEVARRLRLEPEMKDILLVAMTGYGSEEDRQRTQEAGFYTHLIKPVDFDKVEELLSSPPGLPGPHGSQFRNSSVRGASN